LVGSMHLQPRMKVFGYGGRERVGCGLTNKPGHSSGQIKQGIGFI
jgi:hypothetical protein